MKELVNDTIGYCYKANYGKKADVESTSGKDDSLGNVMKLRRYIHKDLV